MRDIPLKTDNSGDVLPASDFNANLRTELQNIVTSADFTLDPAGGPDVDTIMMSKSIAAYSGASSGYQDSGSANSYVLSLSSNLNGIDKYYDNLIVRFKAGNTNTGASTVNINSIGVKNITDPNGNALVGAEIISNKYIFLVYNSVNDRFELIDLTGAGAGAIGDYIPVSKEVGVKALVNGGVYSFDEWDGTDILTQSGSGVAKPIPYKSSLSNVYTGFKVIGYEGNGLQYLLPSNNIIGLNWLKSRDGAYDNGIFDYIRGTNNSWISNSAAAASKTSSTANASPEYSENTFRIGDISTFNTENESFISWHWHYPLAKAWHANGGTSKKVPTPWGIVDSVESNASSGITGDQVVIELYNPLTGNGCLLYVGTGANRLLDISGGIVPEFMIAKNLSVGSRPGTTYHSHFNGGTNPAEYYMDINNTAVVLPSNSYWNDIEPTSNLISLGTIGYVNESNALHMLYYFSSVTGLQDFGGYAGNSTTNNQATGCKDGMFFVKSRLGGVGNWGVVDHIRGDNNRLIWNATNVEAAYTSLGFNTTSGMDISGVDADVNLSGVDYVYGHFGKEMIPQGNFDVYPTNALVSTGSNDEVRIVFEYKGSATLNSELKIYASREASPNWVLGSLTKTSDLSDGYKQIEAIIDISGNAAGTAMRWRLQSNEVTFTEHNIKNLQIIWS